MLQVQRGGAVLGKYEGAHGVHVREGGGSQGRAWGTGPLPTQNEMPHC